MWRGRRGRWRSRRLRTSRLLGISRRRSEEPCMRGQCGHVAMDFVEEPGLGLDPLRQLVHLRGELSVFRYLSGEPLLYCVVVFYSRTDIGK